MILKILSFNIWIDGNIDNVKSFLQNANADIIGLQEVKDHDPKRDIIGFLDKLGYRYVFAPVKHRWWDNIYNNGPAIFSRFGITSAKVFLLSEKDPYTAIKADINIQDKIVHVYNAHFDHDHLKDTKVQKDQGQNLIKEINPNEPTIVMGDFNALPTSSTITAIQNILIDTDPASQPTWSLSPEGCKICNPGSVSMKLDYIFTSRNIKTKSFQVENSKGSDHLAISAIVEL